MKTLDLKRVKLLPFPATQYMVSEHVKKQLVYHHTGSGRGIDGDYHHWLNDPSRIATALIIDEDGTPNQLFNSRFWAYHLGMKNKYNLARNQETIGIELDNWGPLIKVGKSYYSYTGTKVDPGRVVEYDDAYGQIPNSEFFKLKGAANKPCHLYQSYTDEQIETGLQCAVFFNEKYGIPLDYHEDMWELSERAVKGTPGIWSHRSFRADKTDAHPQPEFINGLKQLTLSK